MKVSVKFAEPVRENIRPHQGDIVFLVLDRSPAHMVPVFFVRTRGEYIRGVSLRSGAWFGREFPQGSALASEYGFSVDEYEYVTMKKGDEVVIEP